MSFDLNLAGNLILDRICELDAPLLENASNPCAVMHDRSGGIGNLARALAGRGMKLHVDGWVGRDLAGSFVQRELEALASVTLSVKALENQATSTAVILADRSRAERTSVVRWGACREIDAFTPVQSRWTHLSYLDALDAVTAQTLEGLRARTGALSVDLCRSDHGHGERQRLLRLLAFVDHVVLSDVEAESLVGRRGGDAARALGALVGRSAIVHSPSGSHASDGRVLVSHDAGTPLTGLNPLGAGDRFCAEMLVHLVDARAGVPEVALLAHCHSETTAFLRNQS